MAARIRFYTEYRFIICNAMKKFIATVYLGLLMVHTYGQNNDESIAQIIQNRLTFVAENNADNIDLNALTEIYWQFAERPIALNLNSIDDLASLQLLSPITLQHLKQHLYKYGSLISIYELQAVEGMTLEKIRLIEPFVTCSFQEKSFDVSNPSQEILYRLSTNNQHAIIPVKDSLQLGMPVKHYLRYRFNTQNLQLGFNAENDAGEPFFNTSRNPGFDHYGAFISINNVGIIKQAVFGDYQANFGQGLVLWTGFGFGKSTYTQQVVKIENGIRPYSSSQESNYLRGATATIQTGKWQLTPLIVYRKAEANITDTLDGQLLFSSIESTGLHRTTNELSRRKTSQLKGAGFNSNYQFKKLRVGLTYFQYEYNGIVMNTNAIKNYWKQGNLTKDNNVGVDLLYSTANGIYFGEIALNQQNHVAGILGTTQALGKQLNTTIVYRNYPASNNPRYKLGFAERNTANESGIYWGTEVQLSNQLMLSGYIDLYHTKWLNSNDILAKGQDKMLKISYTKKRNYTGYLMLRNETSDEGISTEQSPLNTSAIESIDRFRLQLTKSINKHLNYESRIELSKARLHSETNKGWLVYQNLKYATKFWSFSIRYTKYATPNFDTRIYAYEQDVLYAFRTPAYYLVGNSYYILIKRKFKNGLSTWLRFANNRRYLPQNQIVSTNLENHYAITAQVQWKF